MKTIVVGTDLSERSDRAMSRAAMLAKQSGATLHVLHVVDDELPTSIAQEQQKNVEALLNRQIANRGIGADIKVEIHVVFGNSWSTLLDQVEVLGADLVVLGTHRSRGFLDRFRGTTIERVAASSPVPLLTVSEQASAPYQRPLVGVDFSQCACNAANLVASIAPGHPVTFLNAYHIPYRTLTTRPTAGGELSQRDKQRIEASLKGEMTQFEESLNDDVTYEWLLVEGSPSAILDREARRLDADLVCVGPHARSWLSKALLGSTAEQLLTDPPCDVLVTPLARPALD
ncbi:universal stress protein [Aliiroseovarius sediminis]|uniref:universal stress protein n=1 Tax=Aliiroseovarius sediminis TaxID=2925839 RepID=UPI001F585792|nr:universal stress protein [Aliiroseovarius sediminis]MCI2394931.1 universal stress protein [Aliiroseovarius sediminis]